MANTHPGGMFSKLINPDTAQPTTIKPAKLNTVQTLREERPELAHPPTMPQAKQSTRPLTEQRENGSARRKQISAYLTHQQLHLLKQLYFRLNAGETQVEKSEIIGLGVELLYTLVDTQVLKYTGIHQVRDQLSAQVSKLLETQVSKHSST